MTLSAGRLVLANVNALGSGTLTLNGGTLDEILPSDMTITNAVALSNVTFAGSGNLIPTNGDITLAEVPRSRFLPIRLPSEETSPRPLP